MRDVTPPEGSEEEVEDFGCAYIVDEPSGRRHCGAPRQRFSSYCPYHHSLCYIAGGSNAEAKRLCEVEKLANAVGGRRGQRGARPSQQFLERLEHVVRRLSRPKGSRSVPEQTP